MSRSFVRVMQALVLSVLSGVCIQQAVAADEYVYILEQGEDLRKTSRVVFHNKEGKNIFLTDGSQVVSYPTLNGPWVAYIQGTEDPNTPHHDYLSSRFGIYIYDLNKKKEYLIRPPNGFHGQSTFSPNGRYLAFSFDADGNKQSDIGIIDLAKVDLNKINPATGVNADFIIKADGMAYYPSLSPDGKKIAFHITKANSEQSILMTELGSSEKPQVLVSEVSNKAGGKTKHVLAPSFSLDGTKICFTAKFEGMNYEMYELEIASKKATQLTNHPGIDSRGTYTPEGEIVFASTRSGRIEAATVDPEHPESVRIYLSQKNGDIKYPQFRVDDFTKDPTSVVPS